MFTGGIFREYIILIPALSWIISQAIKIILYSRYRSIKGMLEMFKSGGMPSAHTAFLSSLTVAIGLKEGFGSSLFALALAFTGIVAYDAMHVRNEAGKHAQVLNVIHNENPIPQKDFLFPLEESIGHNFWQVVAGGALGTYLGFMLYVL